jgi:alanyl-tRNA synthetase
MLTGSQIRRKFLDYFIQKGHREVHSSSLVPANDPTLLFTNAGMNQFKDVFLGLEKRDYNRATTSQKCVRAGGKHNDLENVGFTNRHHTFFEMLGNFSFGDYFKDKAIAYAWELITSPEWFGIEKEKLYATIFEGSPLDNIPRDDEAEQLWLAVGVPQERIFAMGMKDNFWQMGDTGPCGPCSEIHYDMGPKASEQGHIDCGFPCDCGRYVEIWNLVFMQYDRQPRAEAPVMLGFKPLPKPSIDTGMGLERTAAVLQDVISNYDTDLFKPLINKAVELTGIVYQDGSTKTDASLRIIADHARAATFLISDGVLPSNEGRGYVLRKILRRAFRHGRALRFPYQIQPFMDGMVYAVRDLMKDAYPELIESTELVAKVVKKEEEKFYSLLGTGMDSLQQLIRSAKRDTYDASIRKAAATHGILLHEGNIIGAADRFSISDILTPQQQEEAAQGFFGDDWRVLLRSIQNARPILSGGEAFRLYDTFGMPLDFIQDAARDQGIVFDQAGFDRAMAEQRERAKASWRGGTKDTAAPIYRSIADGSYFISKKQAELLKGLRIPAVEQSVFEGYRQSRSDNCEVLAIIKGGQGAQELNPGDPGEIILDHTSFYAESGGQVGDRGWFYSDDHNTVVAEVTGCYYPVQGVRAHQVVAKQAIRVGQKVDAVVDTAIREATMRNHTATHLLQAGLREVLGKHVKQAGSLVAPNHLRFDFSHFTGVAEEELQDIEDIINKEVLRNEKVEIVENVPIDVAINEYRAMALFGEKYGDRVRVIKIGDFSTELCGGTHTAQTGEIGLIKILKEGSVSSGVRRIEAVTGEGSLRHFRKDHELEEVVAALTTHAESTSPAEALKLELEKKDAEIKRLARELDQARMKSASSSTANIGEKVREVRGVKVLTHRVDNLERAQMRTLVDQLRDKLGSAVVVLGSASNGNVSLIVGVTKDLTGRIQAGKIIGPVAQKVGGKGGGRPDLAEAGGKNAAALDAALGEAYSVVESLLG